MWILKQNNSTYHMPHRKFFPALSRTRNQVLWRHETTEHCDVKKYFFGDVTVNGTRAVKYYLVLFLHRMFAQWLVAKTIEFVDRRVCLQKVQICTCPHFEKFKFTHAHISKSINLHMPTFRKVYVQVARDANA